MKHFTEILMEASGETIELNFDIDTLEDDGVNPKNKKEVTEFIKKSIKVLGKNLKIERIDITPREVIIQLSGDKKDLQAFMDSFYDEENVDDYII